MKKNIELDKIKEKRDGLVESFNGLQDKKQIEVFDNDLLTLRGAILLCNEWVGELEPTKEVEIDGGQTNN